MTKTGIRAAIGLCACLVVACSSGDGGDGSGFLPPVDPGPGGIMVSASGGIPAIAGYAFPPAASGDPAFVDGWQIAFSRLLVTFDKITLAAEPDVAPGDQAQTGAVVAEADGPWAVDLVHRDPDDLEGEGDPGERAVAITAFNNQNKNGNKPFATDGTRYALGFEVVTAATNAMAVNLDAAAAADYQQMVQDGCSVLYVGTATFMGGTVPGYTGCNRDHDSWPAAVNFRLCFKAPTRYANCQNPENDPAPGVGGEASQRGVALLRDDSVISQITMRPDQPFWDSVLRDSPARFDQFAARVLGQTGTPTATLQMTQGVDFAAYTDSLGNPAQWRSCMAVPDDAHDVFTGPMAFDPGTVPRATGGDPATGLRDYYDFATYNQSAQWYLNEDGLCAVARNYASPL